MVMRLYVLGRFQVSLDDVVLPSSTWRRRRAVDLLTALAVAPDHAISKEELIAGFWPSKDASRGANNLHRALHDVRKALSGPLVGIDRGRVRLDPTAWVDVAAFEQGCADDDGEALELYRGHPDLDLDGVQPRLEALRKQFVDSSLRAARRRLASDPDRAISVLRRLLQLEPTAEEGHRLVMRALGETGRVGEALAQFEACTEALHQQLGVSPSTPTVTLADTLRTKRSAAAPASATGLAKLSRMLLGTADPTPPRGRASITERIQQFVAEGSGVLLLTGAAGIGKTRMAVEAARAAEAAGAVLMAGAGLDFDGMPPFAPFIEAFTTHDRATGAGDNPFLAFEPSGSVQDDTLRLFQSVQQALSSIGGGRSVCLVLDDLHQADASSLHLLHYLARATRDTRLILVGTTRPEGLQVGTKLHAVAAGMHRERLATRIDLTPMDRAATRVLIEDMLGEPAPPEVVDRVHDLAEGNAFYIEELVHAWSDSGQVAVPQELSATVLERVNRLGPDAEALLRAAAVVGQHFEHDLCADVSGLAGDPALDALERSIEADLVRDDDGRYRFRHALVREALYGRITGARLRSLHRRVAAALETPRWLRAPDRIERLAHHHRQADDADKAVPYLLEAAIRARQQTGLREAVTFYSEALELVSHRPADPQQFDILLGLGQAQLLLSELADAVTSLDRAAALSGPAWCPDGIVRGRALRLAGLALITSGHLDEAEVRIQAALDALDGTGDDIQLADTLYYMAQLRWHQNRHADAYSVAERCLERAEASGDPKAIARGYEMLALACHSLGAWHEGEQYEEQRQSLVGGPVDVAQAFDVHL